MPDPESHTGIVTMATVRAMVLTPKQQRFVEEYLVDLNATQAAIRAGYSAKTARVIGQQNLLKLDIQIAIQEAMKARAERTQVSQDSVVAELARLGFADMGDYVSWGPDGVSLKANSDLPEGASVAVAEVSEHVTFNRDGDGGTRTMRFKLHDKKGALDSLAKHLGMFVDRKEINVNTHWRFTIGKGYDETEAPGPGSRVVNGHVVDEIPPRVGAE